MVLLTFLGNFSFGQTIKETLNEELIDQIGISINTPNNNFGLSDFLTDGKAIDCSVIGDQIVDTDVGENTYTHIGNTWDVTAPAGETIHYELSGATVASGNTTLDGVTFNIGETTVTWSYGDEPLPGEITECSFKVTVKDTEFPTIIIGCDRIGDQDVDAMANTPFHHQVGTAWDVKAIDNDEVILTWQLNGATVAQGETTLNGVDFYIGLTTVTWNITDPKWKYNYM